MTAQEPQSCMNPECGGAVEESSYHFPDCEPHITILRCGACCWKIVAPTSALAVAAWNSTRRVAELEATNKRMVKAMRKAERVFRDYAILHSDKCTDEGHEKACANYYHAEALLAAIGTTQIAKDVEK